MEVQAEMAKTYGVYGFCYYHYWFAKGKKLLEQPLERMLKNPNIDIPFCLSWDNHEWSKKFWDAGKGSNEIIASQDFSDKENLDRHDYLCEFFADSRYMKEDGKPIFIVYNPNIIPRVNERFQYVRERVKANGFPGILIYAQHTAWFDFISGKCQDFGADAYIQYEPNFGRMSYSVSHSSFLQKLMFKLRETLISLLSYKFSLVRFAKKIKSNVESLKTGCSIDDYDAIWEEILSSHVEDKRIIAGAFVDFDNTPRKKKGSSVMSGATPGKFKIYMRRLIQKVRQEYSSPYIFINAWNEWGEGAYLEPDERYGYAYLEALRDALTLQ